MRVVAKQNDKETAKEDKQRGAGRMGDLQFITAGDKLSAVPEAAGGLHGHDIYSAGDEAYDPTGEQIEAVEASSFRYLLACVVDVYSVFSVSDGFLLPTRRAWKLTVKKASRMPATPASRKTQGWTEIR